MSDASTNPRPGSFSEFHGQTPVVTHLEIAVRSAKAQGKPLGHVLFVGPAGLGKTTLAGVTAAAMGVPFTVINCTSVEKITDLLPVLTTRKAGEVLFLDEVHRLIPAARDYLLTVMEDNYINVVIGEGIAKNIVRVDLPAFTIIAATTRLGVLDGPLRTRFQHTLRLEPYSDAEMAEVLHWIAEQHRVTLDSGGAQFLIPACHGVARLGVNMVRACMDTWYNEPGFAGQPVILSGSIAKNTLARLGYIGELTKMEFRYLVALGKAPNKTAGLSTLAAILDETPSTLEETLEPWLLQRGFIVRKPTGRELTAEGFAYIQLWLIRSAT